MLQISVLNRSPLDPGGNNQGRYTQSQSVESKGRDLEISVVVRVWRICAVRIRRRSGGDVLEKSTVLIIGYDQDSFAEQCWVRGQSVVNIGDQTFAESNVLGRMLRIGHFLLRSRSSLRVIKSRQDKDIIRQIPVLDVIRPAVRKAAEM